MAVFRCRMCGGSLNISDSDTKNIYECEYCGTKQTLSGTDEDGKSHLYDMSVYFSKNNETGNTGTYWSLLKRVFYFLEDGDWDSADEYCERVLDIYPECAAAYLGKLMADLHVHNQQELANSDKPFDDNPNYQKALRFADAELAFTLENYIKQIKERIELNRKQKIYNDGMKNMQKAVSEADYNFSASIFRSISGFKEADAHAAYCLKMAAEVRGKEKEQAETILEERRKHDAFINKSIKLAICGLVILVLLVVMINVVISNSKYNSAQKASANGRYLQAYELFKTLGGYKDSEEQTTETYESLKRSTLSNAEIGDIIYFGTYEQDDSTTNGAELIKWVVIDKNVDKILVISKTCLDYQPYDSKDGAVTWETCSLRKWLNTDFFNSAFSKEDQSVIETTTIVDNDTIDNVFLLSADEVYEYLNETTTWQIKLNNALLRYDKSTNKWWLRSSGEKKSYAPVIREDGEISETQSVKYYNFVRPAMWLDVSGYQ